MSGESYDAELVPQVSATSPRAHPDLVGKLSREDILVEIRAKAKEE